jgi:hypothetical protein
MIKMISIMPMITMTWWKRVFIARRVGALRLDARQYQEENLSIQQTVGCPLDIVVEVCIAPRKCLGGWGSINVGESLYS